METLVAFAAAIDRQTLAAGLAALGALLLFTLAFQTGGADQHRLARRIRILTDETERNRARENRQAVRDDERGGIRHAYKLSMKRIVDRLQLAKWLAPADSSQRLAMAGYRGPQAEIGFLVLRLAMPLALAAAASVFVAESSFVQGLALPSRLAMAVAAAYVGLKLPELLLSSQISRRQAALIRALPDSLDLIVVCVEAGYGLEQSMRRIAIELGDVFPEIADEFGLLAAELSYLPDRREAYDNLARRVSLPAFRALSGIFVQSERYGTSLARSLRIIAREGRDQRMIAAETKAASLGPRLTIPMILFFLPVIFIVVLVPILIKAFALP